MKNEQIKELALECGFKLKEQPNGEMDLNPYVYEFAQALLHTFGNQGEWINVKENLPKKDGKSVLVLFCENGDVGVMQAFFCLSEKVFLDLNDEVVDTSYWQPLAELPKGL